MNVQVKREGEGGVGGHEKDSSKEQSREDEGKGNDHPGGNSDFSFLIFSISKRTTAAVAESNSIFCSR